MDCERIVVPFHPPIEDITTSTTLARSAGGLFLYVSASFPLDCIPRSTVFHLLEKRLLRCNDPNMLVFRSRFLNLLRSNQSRRFVLERRGRGGKERGEKVAQKFMLLFLLLPPPSPNNNYPSSKP